MSMALCRQKETMQGRMCGFLSRLIENSAFAILTRYDNFASTNGYHKAKTMLVLLVGHVNVYPAMHNFWKSQTHSVNDSLHDFDWVFSEKLHCWNVVNITCPIGELFCIFRKCSILIVWHASWLSMSMLDLFNIHVLTIHNSVNLCYTCKWRIIDHEWRIWIQYIYISILFADQVFQTHKTMH